MQLERTIVHIPLDQCPPSEMAMRLKKHAGVDIDDIPSKYGNSVLEAQALIREKLTLSIVYQCIDITGIEGDKVMTSTGHCFSGKMAPRILKGAEQVVCFVGTLAKFNDLRDSSPDVMVNYFWDTWGSIYAECGQSWVEQDLTQRLKDTGQRRAYAWNPGQYQFDLINQRPIFDLLEPDSIGCTLDKHLRMLPFKSTSGIIPILPATAPPELDLLPCDFCIMRTTCPASKSAKS